MDEAPAWLIGIVIAAAMMLAEEAGFRLHLLVDRNPEKAEDSDGAGYIAGAALGLLSLLIGFTFAMSADRYEARRHMVVDEANAISTVWLRQKLLDEPARTRLGVLMRDYVRARQAVFAAGADHRGLGAADASTERLQDRIWLETAAALPGSARRPLAIGSPVISASVLPRWTTSRLCSNG
jgi:hypothetical protein